MIEKNPRFQVFLELKDGSTMPHGPTAPKEFCQRVCEGINGKLIQGHRSPLNVTSAFVQPVLAN